MQKISSAVFVIIFGIFWCGLASAASSATKTAHNNKNNTHISRKTIQSRHQAQKSTAKKAEADNTDPKIVKKFKAWAVYRYKMNGRPICYALSAPITKQPSNVDHGDVYFLISLRNNQKKSPLAIKNNKRSLEPQFLAGYNLRNNSLVRLNIEKGGNSGRDFNMYTRTKFAWLYLPSEELALISQMEKGDMLNVNAISAKNTRTKYKFSLLGLHDALAKVQICQ